MIAMLARRDAGRLLACLGAAVCAALLMTGTGCPSGSQSGGSGTTDNTNTNDSGSATKEVKIVNVPTAQQVSELLDYISILYTATGIPEDATITAFYVEVDGTSTDAEEIGDRVPIPTTSPLTSGENRSFRFYPGDAGVGTFRVGIKVSTSTQTLDSLSPGVIVVQGPPNPRFIRPENPTTQVQQGESVDVRFDAGDPQGEAQWRLFYIGATDPLGPPPDVPPDQIGTTITVGEGNAGTTAFGTFDLAPGRYELGVAATDSGDSVQNTVGRGEANLVVTIPNQSTPEADRRVIVVEEAEDVTPPTIAFLAPSSSEVRLFGNEPFLLQFTVTVAAGEVAFIDLFHDTDNNPDNGFTLIPGAINLPSATTSFAFPTDLPEGTYRVGAVARQGSLDAVIAYAVGAISVIRTPTLTVTAPNTSVPIRPLGPLDGSDTTTVVWTTNVPPGAGTVDVFARSVDSSDIPFGPEIPVLEPSSAAVTSAEFGSETSGRFQLSVRILFDDPSFATLVRTAPEFVRVSSAPAVLWIGSLADADPPFEGAIFEGVNFEDNAGTSFAQVEDLNGDDIDEFVIAARYGKPFFTNPTGVGAGEAYLVFGSSPARTGSFNLNNLGNVNLPGVTFTGIRPPQAFADFTSGLSSVSRIPDVDGDGRAELVFGFPWTASRGHNASPIQDGVVDPRSLDTLEREYQFERGGIVMVSSRNNAISSPSTLNSVIELDLVGQDFDSICVEPEPDELLPDDTPAFASNVHADFSEEDGGCAGSCEDPSSGGEVDATEYIDFGFVNALSRDYFSTYVYSFEYFGGTKFCESPEQFVNHECLLDRQIAGFDAVPHEYCANFVASCEPFSPGLHAFAEDPDGPEDALGFPTTRGRQSGFYTYFEEVDNAIIANDPREPFGARVIGVGVFDGFGSSLTLSNSTGLGAGDIIVTAPFRTARGILLGPDGGPEGGGEINGLESTPGTPKTNVDSGVAYIFRLRSLWTNQGLFFPPRPHQYIVGEASHCGGPFPLVEDDVDRALGLIDNVSAIRVAGLPADNIENIIGIADFNADGLNDFVVGAPFANGGQGRVYVSFRRNPGVEGDYVLEKLSLDPSNPERLTGVLIVTDSIDALGWSLASDVDLNGDGRFDFVIGSPAANNGQGEVIVVFGDPNLTSPVNGITVDTLLNTRNAAGLPRAARITGNALDTSGLFGFNVANAGDIDGDGRNDLLVSAPGATPRFDDDPTDDVDELTEPGVDVDLDGRKDDVSGANGLPDGVVDTSDNLNNAGLVYVVFGSNRLDQISTADITINIDQFGGNLLRGFMIAGRRAGDRIGGGDAGSVANGGITSKTGRGRSFGLASAGDVDGDGRSDLLIGAILADPRRDSNTGVGVQNGGETYLIYGSVVP